MSNKKIIILLIIFIASTSFSSLAWSSENYDDCIIKNMKGIASNLAAREIIDLCKAKHINTKFSICFETDAQTINGIIFLQDMNEPFTGNNLCKYTNDQVKSKGNIKNGKLDGKVTYWYKNGQIWSEEYYIEGNLVDKTKYSYHENGQVKSEKKNKDGSLDGKWTYWYENGLKWLEGNYKNGIKDGKWAYWHKNGLKGSEKNYKDGIKDGKWTTWHENGQIWSEEYYKNSIKDGKWTTWHENGQIWSEEHYKDGKRNIL